MSTAATEGCKPGKPSPPKLPHDEFLEQLENNGSESADRGGNFVTSRRQVANKWTYGGRCKERKTSGGDNIYKTTSKPLLLKMVKTSQTVK